MLKLVPKNLFSWDFTVLDESRPVAAIDMSWWGEKAELTVEGINYDAYREGMFSGDFILESAGSRLAAAQKPSAFQRSFIVNHAGKEYTLRASSALKRQFVLLDDSAEIGSISPDGFLTRHAAVDLPVEIPLPVRIFIVWLVIIMWKRQSDSAN